MGISIKILEMIPKCPVRQRIWKDPSITLKHVLKDALMKDPRLGVGRILLCVCVCVCVHEADLDVLRLSFVFQRPEGTE